jgi:predicted ArsR family transcriptional regulator
VGYVLAGMAEEQEQREREWNEQGEYAEMYSTEETYDILADLPKQVGVTSDIADALGCSSLTARNKLQELRFDRKVKKRDTGGRTSLWYIPDEDDEESADDGEAEDTDMALKRLSREIDGPITLADGTVYEDGDKHSVEQTDAS